MRNTWRLAILTTTFASIVVLTGCEQTRIIDINHHPERYAGEKVIIAGTVTSSVAPSNPGTFEMDDGSGRLWILSSSNIVPLPGTRIAVTGLVESKTTLGSTTLVTTLQEIKRCETRQACVGRT